MGVKWPEIKQKMRISHFKTSKLKVAKILSKNVFNLQKNPEIMPIWTLNIQARALLHL